MNGRFVANSRGFDTCVAVGASGDASTAPISTTLDGIWEGGAFYPLYNQVLHALEQNREADSGGSVVRTLVPLNRGDVNPKT